MIQKKDLAKEFSLLVQQEIKNHNDMILASNSALDEFRRKIQEMSDQVDKKISLLTTLYTSSHVEMRRIEQESKDNSLLLKSSLNDSNALMEKHFKEIKESLQKRESYFLTISGFEEFQEKVDQWISHIKIAFCSQKETLLEETKKISSCLLKALDGYKEDIKNEFLSVQQEQKAINKCLDNFAATFSGFSREIDFCKQRCFVIEKNIENLYTQIERLKGKIT